jgi:hypothetical protein
MLVMWLSIIVLLTYVQYVCYINIWLLTFFLSLEAVSPNMDFWNKVYLIELNCTVLSGLLNF